MFYSDTQAPSLTWIHYRFQLEMGVCCLDSWNEERINHDSLCCTNMWSDKDILVVGIGPSPTTTGPEAMEAELRINLDHQCSVMSARATHAASFDTEPIMMSRGHNAPAMAGGCCSNISADVFISSRSWCWKLRMVVVSKEDLCLCCWWFSWLLWLPAITWLLLLLLKLISYPYKLNRCGIQKDQYR